MANAQINPLLIKLLTGKDDSEIPTISSVPGKYAKKVYSRRKLVDSPLMVNHHMLKCLSCGRNGKYDVGIMTFDIDKQQSGEKVADSVQLTGYFRCKHCNDAGNWEVPTSLLMQSMVGILALGDEENRPSGVGKSLLFDGTWHQYATDAEEHLLQFLKNDPNDSFVWNRLGNLYHKGNRPELAVCAFEQSLKLDPDQVESLFTLGNILAQVDEFTQSGIYLRRMLLEAERYNKMSVLDMREMMSVGLLLLFNMNQGSEGEIPFLPTAAEIAGSSKEAESLNIGKLDLELFPDDAQSFYPIAELFMGERAKEMPFEQRRLKLGNDEPYIYKKKKVKKKRKKR